MDATHTGGPQALNYAPKAIHDLTDFAKGCPPATKAGLLYLASKLRQAQVFILPEHGQLLDRGKPSPEVPGIIFRPPFPVVALEYPSPPATGRHTPGYTDVASSRRISLAWDWQDDHPRLLGPRTGWAGTGVAIASIFFVDATQKWMTVAAAHFLPYEGEWVAASEASSRFRDAAILSGQISPKVADAKRIAGNVIGLMPDALIETERQVGEERLLDALTADLMDECNAYEDLCYALACGNVETEEHPAPARLNKSRRARGKELLKGFHLLKLSGDDGAGAGFVGGAHGSPRPHLRRGHIRHLQHPRYGDKPRVTWVNHAMVRPHGEGFAAKDYDMR